MTDVLNACQLSFLRRVTRDMAGEFFCMAYISGVLDSNSQCGDDEERHAVHPSLSADGASPQRQGNARGHK